MEFENLRSFVKNNDIIGIMQRLLGAALFNSSHLDFAVAHLLKKGKGGGIIVITDYNSTSLLKSKLSFRDCLAWKSEILKHQGYNGNLRRALKLHLVFIHCGSLS